MITEPITRLITRYPALAPLEGALTAAGERLLACFRAGGKLLLCGNGGSAADCLHIAGELLKGFTSTRPLAEEDRAALAALYGDEGTRLGRRLQRGLPAVALPGALALTTAMANDVDADLVYARLGVQKPSYVTLRKKVAADCPS